MKKIFFFLIYTILLVSNICIAQKQNAIWCFGDSAGIDFNNLANLNVITTSTDGRGDCVSICDGNGQLLFYAYGNYMTRTLIYDTNHNLMPNSNLIPSDGYYNGMVIIPKPGFDSLYYLFYHGNYANVQTFFYSLIDMNLNGGLGDISQKNIMIQQISFADCMTAVQHGNGRDWWLIDKYYITPFTMHNRFFSYLITPDSIYPSVIQDFNDMTDGYFQKICWHPTYNKFMLINVAGYKAEYDFDRCTGVITLNRTIFPEQLSNYNRIFFDGAYSPNGNVFYVSRNTYANLAGIYNYLLQYDLTATNIPASCDTLDSTYHPPMDCGALRLAPDGKIYYTQAYGYNFISYPYPDSMRNVFNENLGVVNNPDVVGAGCNFAPFSFHLGGKRTYWGLPNNPDYSLGRLLGSPCDTLQWTNLTPALSKGEGVMRLSPNPVSKNLFFNAKNVKGKSALIQIRNSLGEIIFNKNVAVIGGGFVTQTIDVSLFCNGIYFISLLMENEVVSAKFIKE